MAKSKPMKYKSSFVKSLASKMSAQKPPVSKAAAVIPKSMNVKKPFVPNMTNPMKVKKIKK